MDGIESSAVGSPLPTTTAPGRELDALIAEKVMGWTRITHRSRHYNWSDSGGAAFRILPRYSTDIAAAWLVVEKMREFPAAEYRNLRLVAWCYNRSYATFAADDEADWSEANGEHATPHVICLAALAALANAHPVSPEPDTPT